MSSPPLHNPSADHQKPSALGSSTVSFPVRLLDTLRTADEDIVRWNLAGTAFAILDKEAFEQTILCDHFQRTKYNSFVRKLSRWGFRRVRDDTEFSSDTVIFHEAHFHRDHPQLVKQMATVKAQKRRTSHSMSKPVVPTNVASLAPTQAFGMTYPGYPSTTGGTPRTALSTSERPIHGSTARPYLYPTPILDPRLSLLTQQLQQPVQHQGQQQENEMSWLTSDGIFLAQL